MRKFSEWFYDEVRLPATRFPYFIASLMPRWLAYYCTIRVICHATQGKFSDTVVPEVTAMDVLQRWSDRG